MFQNETRKYKHFFVFLGEVKICSLESGRFQKAGAEKLSSLVSSIIESLEYGINMAASDKELVRRA